MTDKQTGIREQFDRFFYQREKPYGLALIRILIPISLMVPLIPRWPHVRELYSTDGASTPLWLMYGYRTLLPELSGTVAVAMFSILMFLLVTSCIGWCTRISLIGATVLYTYINLLDTISTMTKYSVIATHALLLLSLSNCGALWSVDAWLARRRSGRRSHRAGDDLQAPAWPRRLMQLMIGVVYFGAAITKLHTPTYFDGTQMQFWLVTQLNLANPLGQILALFPSLVVASCYVTVLWEMLFVFLAWNGLRRTIMLSFGVVFHAMTFFLLGLEVFPMICITLYLSFLNEGDFRRLAQTTARWRTRLGNWHPLRIARLQVNAWGRRLGRLPRLVTHSAFTAAFIAAAAGAIAVEHWSDPYDLRRSEGPHALRALDPGDVRAMLAPAPPVRGQDKIFSFDVGTTLVAGTLLDRKRVFRHGDSLVAQVMFNPPHEDMFVDCNLHDEHGRTVWRNRQLVPREFSRMSYGYTLSDALSPGSYALVLTASGRELCRRTITLESGARAASAN